MHGHSLPTHECGGSELISIRAATEHDIPEVLALWSVATTEPSATDDVEGIRALLAVDPASLLLAVEDAGDDATTVGTVIASWDGWRGAMYRLAVLPSHRRHGIASMLVADGERRLLARGARRLHLIVLPHEAAANTFWTAAGYVPQHARLRYVKDLPTEESNRG